MAQPNRSFTTNPNASTFTNTSRSSLGQNPSSALQARIAQKRQELLNLTQLRDLSADLTSQLETLQAKLGQLNDGAQSVGLVLANWENVLGVIRMVGMTVPTPVPKAEHDDDGRGDGAVEEENGRRPKDDQQPQLELPVPLVRIPVQPKTGGGG
ncbi:DASH complex subunit DAD2 [Cladophialophora carrionii]|uniref:DASH complex subunit DAD2 n=1 Tax=Cladophialophora carrionii TaxID=86049 RepID=A0A1C1CCD5_9EURO|nr:DASH complex subunit DAD2 [Cladophialophora carrionii]